MGTGAFSKRDSFGAVSTEDNITIIGGSDKGFNRMNDVWSSTDGLTWKMIKADNEEGFSKRYAFGAAVLKGII